MVQIHRITKMFNPKTYKITEMFCYHPLFFLLFTSCSKPNFANNVLTLSKEKSSLFMPFHDWLCGYF